MPKGNQLMVHAQPLQPPSLPAMAAAGSKARRDGLRSTTTHEVSSFRRLSLGVRSQASKREVTKVSRAWREECDDPSVGLR